MTIVIVTPCAMTPISSYNIQLPLKELSLSMLRGKIPRHLTIESVATLLHHQATALEILSSSVLSLVLALSVCAHRHDSYNLLHNQNNIMLFLSISPFSILSKSSLVTYCNSSSMVWQAQTAPTRLLTEAKNFRLFSLSFSQPLAW